MGVFERLRRRLRPINDQLDALLPRGKSSWAAAEDRVDVPAGGGAGTRRQRADPPGLRGPGRGADGRDLRASPRDHEPGRIAGGDRPLRGRAAEVEERRTRLAHAAVRFLRGTRHRDRQGRRAGRGAPASAAVVRNPDGLHEGRALRPQGARRNDLRQNGSGRATCTPACAIWTAISSRTPPCGSASASGTATPPKRRG